MSRTLKILLISTIAASVFGVSSYLLFQGLAFAVDRSGGATVLHTAVKYPEPNAEKAIAEKIALLIKQGADVHQKNEAGLTPLHYAVAHNNTNAIEPLIRGGADVNELTDGGYYTPLHLAVFYSNEAAAKKLLALGADPSIKNTEGKQAVDLLTESPNREIAALLKSKH